MSSHLISTENLQGTEGKSPVYTEACLFSSLAGTAISRVGGKELDDGVEARAVAAGNFSFLLGSGCFTFGHFGHVGQITGGGQSLNSGIRSYVTMRDNMLSPGCAFQRESGRFPKNFPWMVSNVMARGWLSSVDFPPLGTTIKRNSTAPRAPDKISRKERLNNSISLLLMMFIF